MKTVKIKDLKIGDVFTYDEDELTYEEKIDELIYDTVVVGIVDDYDAEFIYLNYYGQTCFKDDNIEVKVICHYSDIIK